MHGPRFASKEWNRKLCLHLLPPFIASVGMTAAAADVVVW